MSARHWRLLALLFAMLLVLGNIAANLEAAGGAFDFIYEHPYGDKVAHFILSGTLGLLTALGFSTRRLRLGPLRPLVTITLIAAALSFEEATQIFLANRDFDLTDLAAGLLGLFLLGELGARFHPEDSA